MNANWLNFKSTVTFEIQPISIHYYSLRNRKGKSCGIYIRKSDYVVNNNEC